MEESLKKRLIELATNTKEMTTKREWEKDPWLAQLDWTLKKAGKSRGVVSSVLFSLLSFCSSHVKVQEPDEPVPEHDALQVPEDPAWLSTLVTSPPPIVPLLLKLAHNGFPQAKKGGITSTIKEMWANCLPLALRRSVRSLVRTMQKCCWPRAK
jgi:hypothetical protein